MLGLFKVFRRNNITIRGFFKLYPDRFSVRNGVVTVKSVAPLAPDIPPPIVEPVPLLVDPPPVDPLPGTPEFQELSIGERARIVDRRREERQAARRQALKSRLRGMPTTYG